MNKHVLLFILAPFLAAIGLCLFGLCLYVPHDITLLDYFMQSTLVILSFSYVRQPSFVALLILFLIGLNVIVVGYGLLWWSTYIIFIFFFLILLFISPPRGNGL